MSYQNLEGYSFVRVPYRTTRGDDGTQVILGPPSGMAALEQIDEAFPEKPARDPAAYRDEAAYLRHELEVLQRAADRTRCALETVEHQMALQRFFRGAVAWKKIAPRVTEMYRAEYGEAAP